MTRGWRTERVVQTTDTAGQLVDITTGYTRSPHGETVLGIAIGVGPSAILRIDGHVSTAGDAGCRNTEVSSARQAGASPAEFVQSYNPSAGWTRRPLNQRGAHLIRHPRIDHRPRVAIHG